MKREPSITEQQAREIVEKMGRRESYTPKSMNDIYRRIGLEPDEPEQPGKTVTEETETAMADEPSSEAVGETAMPQGLSFIQTCRCRRRGQMRSRRGGVVIRLIIMRG